MIQTETLLNHGSRLAYLSTQTFHDLSSRATATEDPLRTWDYSGIAFQASHKQAALEWSGCWLSIDHYLEPFNPYCTRPSRAVIEVDGGKLAVFDDLLPYLGIFTDPLRIEYTKPERICRSKAEPIYTVRKHACRADRTGYG
jgi:hypothetical protein